MKLPSIKIDAIDHFHAGAIVRVRRILRGLSLRKLAKAMDISAMFLSDLERGKRNWNQERFDKAIKHTTKPK